MSGSKELQMKVRPYLYGFKGNFQYNSMFINEDFPPHAMVLVKLAIDINRYLPR
ncbi:hypothetical protein [Aquibacillus halophilus]|uniref:hypothetical protein n=1 Tax=Aquibacillus halophilus TaxID=930132 RepID=UPI00196ADDDF|nr:hypothetical protein [Aquibacillus halophilus]